MPRVWSKQMQQERKEAVRINNIRQLIKPRAPTLSSLQHQFQLADKDFELPDSQAFELPDSQPRLSQTEEEVKRFGDGRVEARPSQLAGDGLWATVDFKKGELIVSYDGKQSRADQATGEYEGDYMIQTGEFLVDASDPSSLGRYANDAGYKAGNNAEYALVKDASKLSGVRIVLKARKKITAGSEIFVDYGRAYWKQWAKQYPDRKKLTMKPPKKEVQKPAAAEPAAATVAASTGRRVAPKLTDPKFTTGDVKFPPKKKKKKAAERAAGI